MSDLKTNIELDDDGFQRATKRVNAATDSIAQHTKRMDAEGGQSVDRFNKRVVQVAASFFTVEKGIQAANRVFAFGERALEAYNDKFEGLDTNSRRMRRSVDELTVSLGRQGDMLAGTLGLVDRLGDAGPTTNWIEGLGVGLQGSIRTWQSIFTGGESGGILGLASDVNARIQRTGDEAALINEQLSNTLAKISAQDIDSAIIQAELAGPSQALQVLDLQLQQAEARIRQEAAETKGGLGFMGSDGQLLPVEGSPFDSTQLETIFNKIDEVAQRSLDAQRALFGDRKEDHARMLAFADEEDALSRRSLEIQTMALEGMDREAAIARVRLAFDREELKLKKELAGVDEDRLQTELDFLAAQERRQIAATNARLDKLDRMGPEVERSAAIGVLGGRQLVVQQLGTDAQATTAQNTAKMAAMMAGLPQWFQQMIRAMQGQGAGAVYR